MCGQATWARSARRTDPLFKNSEAQRFNGELALKGETQSRRIRAAIEAEIVSGRLLPGAKLDEKVLGVHYGASRTPVREALKQLASEGLVSLRPRASAIVAKHTVEGLAEMFETITFLEAACAALASRRHTAEDRRAICAALDGCAKAAASDNPGPFHDANKRFHEVIYTASHNRYLESQTLNLRNKVEVYRRGMGFHPGLISVAMAEHTQIADAIFKMDEAAASSLMRRHLDAFRDDAVSMAKALSQVSPFPKV
jgi:DNA-binding GntR family transcriptional regulator